MTSGGFSFDWLFIQSRKRVNPSSFVPHLSIISQLKAPQFTLTMESRIHAKMNIMFTFLHHQGMTNVVNIRRSNVPQTRVITLVASILHAAQFNLIVAVVTVCAFGFHGRWSATVTKLTTGITTSRVHVDTHAYVIVDCIRIVYAIHVNIYSWTTERTRACIARADAWRKRTSSEDFSVTAAQLAVFTDWLRQVTRRDARRSLATARRSECWHVRSTSTMRHEDGFARAEALADDSLECETKVFGEKCINHGIYGAIAVAWE